MRHCVSHPGRSHRSPPSGAPARHAAFRWTRPSGCLGCASPGRPCSTYGPPTMLEFLADCAPIAPPSGPSGACRPTGACPGPLRCHCRSWGSSAGATPPSASWAPTSTRRTSRRPSTPTRGGRPARSFQLAVVQDEAANPRPGVLLGLAEGVTVDDARRDEQAAHVRDVLASLSRDYRTSYDEFPAAMLPLVRTFARGQRTLRRRRRSHQAAPYRLGLRGTDRPGDGRYCRSMLGHLHADDLIARVPSGSLAEPAFQGGVWTPTSRIARERGAERWTEHRIDVQPLSEHLAEGEEGGRVRPRCLGEGARLFQPWIGGEHDVAPRSSVPRRYWHQPARASAESFTDPPCRAGTRWSG